MIVTSKITGVDVTVLNTREIIEDEETILQFLVYLDDQWCWVNAEEYQPIQPEGTK